MQTTLVVTTSTENQADPDSTVPIPSFSNWQSEGDLTLGLHIENWALGTSDLIKWRPANISIRRHHNNRTYSRDTLWASSYLSRDRIGSNRTALAQLQVEMWKMGIEKTEMQNRPGMLLLPHRSLGDRAQKAERLQFQDTILNRSWGYFM